MVEVGRDGKRVYLTNSLYASWDAQFYPEGIDGWLVKLDAGEDGSLTRRPGLVRRVQRRAPAPGAPGRRRRVVRLLLLPGRLRCTTLWPWILLGLLGAYHGLNPAMGWLFAVALGMQERDRARGAAGAAADRDRPRGVDRAGRACSCSGSGLIADPSALHLGAGDRAGRVRDLPLRQAARALPLGEARRVNRRELAWWSFLMSTAHGAGLMVAPVLIGAGAATARRRSDHAIAAAQDNGLVDPRQRARAHAARRPR